MKKYFVLLAFVASPLLAQADFDACDRVFAACAAQGFSKDESAPVGKKIWLNCADLIVNQSKAVPKVSLDPKGAEAKYCRDYREARAKFDKDWETAHPRPAAH